MRDEKKCETCRWWVDKAHMARNEDHFQQDGGECRIRAPSGATVETQSYGPKGQKPNLISTVFYIWPPTHRLDWCGEHQPKDPPHE